MTEAREHLNDETSASIGRDPVTNLAGRSSD
jgi:hypothetical protein